MASIQFHLQIIKQYLPAAETATKLLCKLCKVHMGPIIVMNCMLILIAITSSVKIDFVKKPKVSFVDCELKTYAYLLPFSFFYVFVAICVKA